MIHTIRIITLLALSPFALSARGEENKSIEGAWRQVEQKNALGQVYRPIVTGTEVTDCIVGGRFIWTIVQNGKVIGLAGGRYKLEKDKFTEIIEYVDGAVPAAFAGSSFEFIVRVDGDKFTKVGTIRVNEQDIKIDEKWERCKP
jgi:hypothetical protein